MSWTYVICDLNREEIVGTFYEKEMLNQIKKKLNLKKWSREEMISYMLNGKAAITLLKFALIKMILLYKMSPRIIYT